MFIFFKLLYLIRFNTYVSLSSTCLCNYLLFPLRLEVLLTSYSALFAFFFLLVLPIILSTHFLVLSLLRFLFFSVEIFEFLFVSLYLYIFSLLQLLFSSSQRIMTEQQLDSSNTPSMLYYTLFGDVGDCLEIYTLTIFCPNTFSNAVAHKMFFCNDSET